MKLYAIILFASIALSACASSAVPTPTPVPSSTPDYASEARAMMDQYDQAMLKMDSQTIASFYLPDGAAYDNGQLQAQGPEAIRNFLESFGGVVRVDQYQMTITSAQVNGNTVILSGTFQQQYTMLANNQGGSTSGSFTVEWMRQPDGKWLIKKLETNE